MYRQQRSDPEQSHNYNGSHHQHSMNSSSMNMQPMSAAISLPPISAIDFNTQNSSRPMPTTSLQLPPAPRTLPPLPYHYPMPAMPRAPEYVNSSRSVYPGQTVPYHSMHGNRMPLPSSGDLSMSAVPGRPMHKTKEVKRRTKTGCLTCRKRRIKCDEGRPECRNCSKSKRPCAGYDPVFQSQGSDSANSLDPACSQTDSLVHTGQYDSDPISPTVSNYATSLDTSPSRHYSRDYSHNRRSTAYLSQPHGMDASRHSGQLSSYIRSMMDFNRPYFHQKTIDDLCCISGQRAPHAPPLPPDQTPNLESIQKVYDTAFATGLDRFVETGASRWFATQGFNHLVSDRELLGQFLLYLTIVSNNSNTTQPENPLVASQEARVTWALLNLVMRPAHDGNDEAEKIARRIKAVEALMTGEPSLVVRGSMADFIHQEDGGSESEPTPAPGRDTSSTFEKQLNRRSEEFWKLIEEFAETPRSHRHNLRDTDNPLANARKLLDGLENRDIIYSMMILSTSNGQDGQVTFRPGTSQSGSGNNAKGNGGGNGNGNGNGHHHHQQEIALARRFLEHESGGRGTNLVFQTLAGMAYRAFSE